MTTTTINQIKEALTPIANKIGEGAGYSWEVVVRQQRLEGIMMLIGILFLTGVVWLGVYLFSKRKTPEDGYEIAGLAIGTIAGIILGVLIITFIFEGLTHIINPEFHAIQFFMNLAQ